MGEIICAIKELLHLPVEADKERSADDLNELQQQTNNNDHQGQGEFEDDDDRTEDETEDDDAHEFHALLCLSSKRLQ